MTMTKPKVMSIKPRLMRSRRQHRPFVLGQKGLGADIVSTTAPPLREVFVLTVDISDGAGPLRYE